MKPVPHGEPYAGKLHVRFDEGAGVPYNKGRPALLYTLGAPQVRERRPVDDERCAEDVRLHRVAVLEPGEDAEIRDRVMHLD